MSVLLKTDNSAYLLDPDNEDLVLKKNGKFSAVYIGYRVDDKLPVIIKKLKDPGNIQTQFRFQKESILGFNRQGIQNTIDAYRDDTGYYIIKEFIDGLSLRQLMKVNVGQRDIFIIKCILKVVDILTPLHQEGITHCDIRPDNIMVKINKRGMPDLQDPQITLIDFGLSKTTETDFHTTRTPFSLIYSPPEQLLNFPDYINASSDLFSLGLTLYECIAQYPPFFNQNPEMVMHLQLGKEVDEHKNIRKELLTFIRKATSKKQLRLPPSQLELTEIEQTVSEGKKMRFASCMEFKEELENVLKLLLQNTKPKSFFEKLFS
jgi:serine/threonine protein kinase